MSNQFTERAQRVILIAQEEAKRLNHNYVGTEHILLGLIALGEGVAAQALANLGVDLRRVRGVDLHRVRSEIEKIVGTGDNVMLLGEIPFTPRAKKVLEYAVEEAQHMGHSYVGTEHLLLGLIREEEGGAARVLENLGLCLDSVREETLSLLDEGHELQKPPQAGMTETNRVARMFYFLAMNDVPFRVLCNAVEEARDIRRATGSLFDACKGLAKDLEE